jgi:tRNA pseudouridine38-40 synthase
VNRYFLELSYHGKQYYGWQIQPEHPSVQKMLQDKLSVLLGSEVGITGAGRTDTGVSASYFTAHFDSESIADQDKFLYNLNSLLPEDILVYSLLPVKGDAHARFDALKRKYKYVILRKGSAFAHNLCFIYKGKLNLVAMQEASAMLPEYDDFTSFAKLHSNNTNNHCELFESYWEESGPFLIYTISANRFLRNMVRSITGTLLEVGRGKRSIQEFREIIERKDNAAAGQSAPARGLYLFDIEYPEDYDLNNPIKESTLPFIYPY